MPKNINSAYRIREILALVSKNQDKTAVHEVWATAFGIEEKDQNKKNFAISRCLADLHEEVELVRAEMSKIGYSQNLYNSSLNKCNSIFAVQLVMGQWQQIKQQLTPEVILALGFCSDILPNEEDLINQENLDDLKAMAQELRKCLEKSTLPKYTITIIEKHLNKIEEAISTYKIIGAKALEDALQSAYGEVIANEVVFEEAKGTEELGRLSKIWQKTKIVVDGVVDTNKRLGAVQGMAEKGQKVIEFLQDFNV